MKKHLALAASFLALTILAPAFGFEWPQWRGPEGQGHAKATGLPIEWSETKNITWKTPIVGRGWSSPVIEGDQVWVTTAIETPATPEETARRLKENNGNTQPLSVMEKVDFRAVCVDRATGRILHDLSLFTERRPQAVHTLNSYASPTSVIENGRLYSHFGSSGTVCLDTKEAKILWTMRDLVVQHENGPGSSPILWRNLLIFHMDGSDKQYIVALDKATGKLVWKTDRTGAMNSNPQLKKSYATPMVIPVDGQEQLISQGADWLYAYDPATGKELWKLKYGALGFSLASRMVTGHGMMYICTGFMNSQLLAVRYGGGQEPAIVWRYTKGVPKTSSPLLVGDELYFIDDTGGMFTCLDAKTGKENYRQRIGGDHSASPLYADKRIYIPGRSGVTSVIEPGKTFKSLANNQLEGQMMASHAVAGRAFFIRTEAALYRIELKEAAQR